MSQCIVYWILFACCVLAILLGLYLSLRRELNNIRKNKTDDQKGWVGKDKLGFEFAIGLALVVIGIVGAYYTIVNFPDCNGEEVISPKPVAHAGPDQEITLPVSTVRLQAGQRSATSNITYSWIKLDGPACEIVSPHTSTTVVRRLTRGIYTFELTVTNHLGAIDKDLVKVVVKPVPPPAPQVIHVRGHQIRAIGGWARTRGDNEMAITSNDHVPANLESEITFSDQEVVLYLKFKIEEDGENYTTFEDLKRVTIFSAPAGKKIVDVKVSGDRKKITFSGRTDGPSNGRQELFDTPIERTYWHELKYVADGPGPDHNRVGIVGKIDFDVVIKNR